jgi:hypothetical protein
MHSVEAKIQARAIANDRLHEVTALIAMGALAALGLFGVIAAATIPGHAAAGPSADSANGTTAGAPASTGATTVRHHDWNSGGISSSSGPPLVVSGGSH